MQPSEALHLHDDNRRGALWTYLSLMNLFFYTTIHNIECIISFACKARVCSMCAWKEVSSSNTLNLRKLGVEQITGGNNRSIQHLQVHFSSCCRAGVSHIKPTGWMRPMEPLYLALRFSHQLLSAVELCWAVKAERGCLHYNRYDNWTLPKLENMVKIWIFSVICC